MSPPPPPPYCLCEERGERLLPLQLPPQVPWEPPGEVVGGWGGPGWGSWVRSPLMLPGDSERPVAFPCPPPRVEAPEAHRGGPGPPPNPGQGAKLGRQKLMCEWNLAWESGFLGWGSGLHWGGD